jgi:hypothetical protein
MHPCISTTILLLLSNFSLAYALPRIPLPKTTSLSVPTTPPDHRTGCHTPHSFFRTFLAFTTPEDSDFTFAIQTKYTTYYPAALNSALRLDAFEPYHLSTAEYCGWTKAKSVHATTWLETGRHRGDVY